VTSAVADSRAPARTRRRLSRTFSRSRWGEYRAVLVQALTAGYRIVPAEEHYLEPPPGREPVLLLRHDVDQAPRSAITMADVEQRLGVRASWYFRWRTARPEIVTELRRRGGTIGLHYETLTRRALAGAPADPAAARAELRAEIAAFAERFGETRSACAHGDTRVPGVRNLALLEGEDPAGYGLALDLDAALRGRPLGGWLTDRSRAEGRWKDGIDPRSLIAEGVTPLLCLTHPNNWISGPSLWRARFAGAHDEPPLSPSPPERSAKTRTG
jgi:hypothetical protein